MNIAELEVALSKAIDRSVHNYFKNEDWEFQESECFSGNAGVAIMGQGGHGVILHFINTKTGVTAKVEMPIQAIEFTPK